MVKIHHNFRDLRLEFPAAASLLSARDLFSSLAWFELLATKGNTFDAPLQLIVASDPHSGSTLCIPTVDTKYLHSLSNYYSGLYGPLYLSGTGENFDYTELCQWFYAHRRRWPTLDFQPLDKSERFCQQLQTGLQNAGYWTDLHFRFGNWFLDVAGQSYEQYLSQRSSRLQHTIERGRKKALRAGTLSLEIHQNPGMELDNAIVEFSGIYSQSNKPAESHPQFIAALCQLAASHGILRLGILKLNGVPVASQLWLVHQGKASIYKLAHSEKHNAFSAGTLLTAHLMQQVIDVDQVREVDYLSGDEAYKKEWMSGRRERHGLIAFNPSTWAGLIHASKHFAGRFLKSLGARRSPK